MNANELIGPAVVAAIVSGYESRATHRPPNPRMPMRSGRLLPFLNRLTVEEGTSQCGIAQRIGRKSRRALRL
jgi:hypothetical protein